MRATPEELGGVDQKSVSQYSDQTGQYATFHETGLLTLNMEGLLQGL